MDKVSYPNAYEEYLQGQKDNAVFNSNVEEFEKINDYLKLHIINYYEDRKLGWKKRYDYIMTEHYVRALYKTLLKENIIPSKEEEFFFVSPTASEPTHEVTLAIEDAKMRENKSHFLTGDICASIYRPKFKYFIQKYIQEHDNFEYDLMDAEKLPVEDNSVDIIWDFKGWIYYLSHKCHKDRLLDTFKHYHSKLKNNGSLIIDDDKEDSDGFKDTIPTGFLFDKKISKAYFDEKEILIFEYELRKIFEIIYINRGDINVRVFKKR